jgi:hemerythrin
MTMDKKLITGIKDIDEQHESLFLAMDLFEKQTPTKDLLWDILLDIERYSKLHFETEEAYMFKYAYPLLEEHTKEHANFSKTFEELKLGFEESGFSDDFIEKFKTFMMTWLSNHYQHCDVHMANFLLQKM